MLWTQPSAGLILDYALEDDALLACWHNLNFRTSGGKAYHSFKDGPAAPRPANSRQKVVHNNVGARQKLAALKLIKTCVKAGIFCDREGAAC